MTKRRVCDSEAPYGDPGMHLGRLALGLSDSAAASTDARAVIRDIGRLLSAATLRVDRIFVSAQPLHPAFRARTYLWLADDDRVRVIDWPHGLKNRPGYLASRIIMCTRRARSSAFLACRTSERFGATSTANLGLTALPTILSFRCASVMARSILSPSRHAGGTAFRRWLWRVFGGWSVF